MNIVSSRPRAAAIGLAAVAVAGGLVSTALPAGAAGKSSVPAPAAPLVRVELPSAVTPASAQLSTMASQDGACQVGDVCLYYFSSANGYGSRYDTSHNDPGLGNNHFISFGSGRGSVVANNTEAVWNRDPRTSLTVCTGSGYTQTCGSVGPNVLGNFTPTYRNNVESLYWSDSAN